MKKSIVKIIAVCLCAAITFGGVVFTASSLNSGYNTNEESKQVSAAIESKDESVFKDETVYILANADGSTDKIIVSDWIKNKLKNESLNDKTELTDIENVKGNETYTDGNDNTKIWDADGNDIYYQGNIDKELPVDLKISYKLDGKDISPSELVGKSGRVTIRFDYTNKQFEYREINGKKEKIYVPYAMLTGVVLDNEVFANAEITNGRLINDGSRTVVVGTAFPGLQENLGISKEDFEIPDYVEITADAENFELGMTLTLATNELFNEIDTDSLDKADDLKDSVKKLTDGMDKLLDGSSELYDGLSELLDKSGELTDGINQLADGADTLKGGTAELDNGASSLQSGAKQLSDGLNTLSSENDKLNGGAEQVFKTLLSTAESQLKAAGLEVPTLTIANYSKVLDDVIASLDKNAVYEKALNTVKSAVEEKRPYITEQVTAAVRQEVEKQVTAAVKNEVTPKVEQAVRENVRGQILAAMNMDSTSYDAAVSAGLIDKATQQAVKNEIEKQMKSDTVLQTIEAKTEEQMNSKEIRAAIEDNVAQQMKTDNVKNQISSNTEAQVQKAISDNMASDEVQSQLTAASEGAKSVISLKSSLDSYNTFYTGLQTYTSGVSQAADGANELKNGTDDLKKGTQQLHSGSTELYDGIMTLKDSTPTLIDGIKQLRDGSGELRDGLVEFNDEGIQKLADIVNKDLNNIVERLRATKEVSLSYKSFAGIDDSADGQVKFIYKTDSLEK